MDLAAISPEYVELDDLPVRSPFLPSLKAKLMLFSFRTVLVRRQGYDQALGIDSVWAMKSL
jgi:hypothetical protein